jgi:hypothetical protein
MIVANKAAKLVVDCRYGHWAMFFFFFFFFAKLDEILLQKPFIIAEKYNFPGLFF